MLVHSSTVLTRSPKALLSVISRLSKTYSEHPLLFSLSSNVNPHALTLLVKQLVSFSSQTAGCLTAPLLGQRYQSLISCSFALFDPQSSVLFRSAIPGRRQPQVGRWHAFRNNDDDTVHTRQKIPDAPFRWADVWDGSNADISLPPELRNLNINDVGEVIFFSDLSPEGLSNSLVAFPNATKLGLVAASTPFVTGRPVTLFQNQAIYGSGAVGIALKSEPKSRAKPRTEFMGMIPLSPPMTITRCEGNLIHSLDNSNPSQLLLNAIRKGGMNKDTSASFEDKEAFLLGVTRNGILTQMHNITAGDPSRGSISIEPLNNPVVGSQVQFYHRPKSTVLEVPTRVASGVKSLAFLTSTEMSSLVDSDNDRRADAGVIVLSDQFIASSENGFILNRSGEAAWTCSVVGCLATLEWTS